MQSAWAITQWAKIALSTYSTAWEGKFFKIFSIFVVNQARWKLYRQIKKAWKLEYSL